MFLPAKSVADLCLVRRGLPFEEDDLRRVNFLKICDNLKALPALVNDLSQ